MKTDNDFEYKRAFAGMLASENIHITEDIKAESAYFNTESRTLVLPIWEIGRAGYQMLCLHEVSHALFTDVNFADIIKKAKIPIEYFNIIEDMRIEKLMKRKFRGSHNTFREGYAEVIEYIIQKNRSWAEDMSNSNIFIDQINNHYKFGVNYDTWTKEELMLYSECCLCETTQDVIDICLKLCKKQKEEEEQSGEEKSEDGEGDSSEEQSGGEGGGGEGGGGEGGGDSGKEFNYDDDDDDDDDEEDYTDIKGGNSDDFQKNLNINDLDDMRNNRCRLPSSTSLLERVIPWEINLKNMEDLIERNIINVPESWSELYAGLNSDSIHAVNEFKRKQNAISHSRIKTSNSGELDLNKLHQYKTSDDIFLRNTILHKGKSHGLILSLDWSSSMSISLLKANAEKAISLCIFCRKVGISFSVQLWTTDTNDLGFELHEPNTGEFRLFSICKEVLSSEMNLTQFNRACTLFYAVCCRGDIKYFESGGTGTASTFLIQAEWARQWRTRLNIEKVTNIMMTDGEPNTAVCYDYNGHVDCADEIITPLGLYANTPAEASNRNCSENMVSVSMQYFRDRCNGSIIYVSVNRKISGIIRDMTENIANGVYKYHEANALIGCTEYVIRLQDWLGIRKYSSHKPIKSIKDIKKANKKAMGMNLARDFYRRMAEHVALGE